MGTWGDWIHWICGAAVALMGLVLLVRSVAFTGGRRRCRCPKCWYDMAGVPFEADSGVVCPECGRVIRRERDLHRTRRRLRWMPLGLLFLAAGGNTFFVPSRPDKGWTRWVPTTALCLMLPHLGTEEHGLAPQSAAWPDARTKSQSRYILGVAAIERMKNPAGPVWQRHVALWTARNDGTRSIGSAAWNDHYFMLIDAIEGLDQADPSILYTLACKSFELPKSWVRGAPLWWYFNGWNYGDECIAARVRLSEDDASAWSVAPLGMTRCFPPQDRFLNFCPGPAIYEEVVEVQVGSIDSYWSRQAPVTHHRIQRRIRLVDDPHELIEPIKDSVVLEELHETLRAKFTSSEWPRVTIAGLESAMLPRLQDFLRTHPTTTFALRAEVVAGSTLLASFELQQPCRESELIPDYLDPEALLLDHSHACRRRHPFMKSLLRWSPGLELRLIGDPIIALRDKRATHYWQGEVRLPLTRIE